MKRIKKNKKPPPQRKCFLLRRGGFFKIAERTYKPSSVVCDNLSRRRIAAPLKPPFGSTGPVIASQLVLHRIGFTWQQGSPCSGELLPRLSTLAVVKRRYISVALSLRSPSADVISYPVLSSTDFPHGHKCPRHRMFYS